MAEHIVNFLNQGSQSEGYLEKLHQIMLLVNNYMAQIRERSVELLEQLLEPLLQRVLAIGVLKSDTSDVEKQQIKA